MEDLISALEEESPVAVHRRATIGVGLTASTPAASAPPVSGVKSVTAHVLDVRRQIAALREAGLDDDADEMEAGLKLFLRSMTQMGSGPVAASPPASVPKGFSFSIPSVAAASGSVSVSALNRDFDAMTVSFKGLVQDDAGIQKLRHTIQPDSTNPAVNAAFVKAVEAILARLRAVRPHGERLANLITQVLLQLDPTPHLAADACFASGELTSWRQAQEQLQPFLNVDRFRTVDGHAGDLFNHVSQLRTAYAHILGSDEGSDRGALRALDRLICNELFQVLSRSWGNITPSVTSAQNVVELVTMVQSNLRFGPEELYELLCRRLEQPVRVPVQAATSTPIYGYVRVLAALHDYRMQLHHLVHHQAAIRQLRLLLKLQPKATDAHLDHSFQAIMQGLLQEAKRSDGSRADVKEVIHQCLVKCSDLEFRGDLEYAKSGKSTDDAFLARTEQGGGGPGRGSCAGKVVCRAWSENKRCGYGDKCKFKHAQQEQPEGSRPDPSTIPCSHFLLHGKCTPFGGRKCPFRHSQPEQPAVHAKAEPPPKEDAESSSRGRTGDRIGPIHRQGASS